MRISWKLIRRLIVQAMLMLLIAGLFYATVYPVIVSKRMQKEKPAKGAVDANR